MNKISFDPTGNAQDATFSNMRISSGKNAETASKDDQDIVIISEKARELAASEKISLDGGKAGDVVKDEKEDAANYIEDRIRQLQDEIKEIQESDLPEKEKNRQIPEKQTEIMELLAQQGKGKKGPGIAAVGTRAGSSSITGKGSLT